jgi:hypothetical protein
MLKKIIYYDHLSNPSLPLFTLKTKEETITFVVGFEQRNPSKSLVHGKEEHGIFVGEVILEHHVPIISLKNLFQLREKHVILELEFTFATYFFFI